MATVAAVVAGILLGGIAVFQLALAAGVAAGAHAYGGRVAQPDGTLPTTYRVASAVAAVVLVVAAWILLAAADLVGPGPLGPTQLTVGCWVIAGFLAVNSLGNLTSTSRIERSLFGPVAIVAAVLAAVVAIS